MQPLSTKAYYHLCQQDTDAAQAPQSHPQAAQNSLESENQANPEQQEQALMPGNSAEECSTDFLLKETPFTVEQLKTEQQKDFNSKQHGSSLETHCLPSTRKEMVSCTGWIQIQVLQTTRTR